MTKRTLTIPVMVIVLSAISTLPACSTSVDAADETEVSCANLAGRTTEEASRTPGRGIPTGTEPDKDGARRIYWMATESQRMCACSEAPTGKLTGCAEVTAATCAAYTTCGACAAAAPCRWYGAEGCKPLILGTSTSPCP